jgi:hypothetical protein
MAKAVRKIREIVKRFKRRCQSKGWRVIEREDIIKKNDEFHNILWTQKIHPSTFKRVAAKETSTIKEGTSYRPIDVAYNAWICTTPLSPSLKQTIARNPQFLRRNAIYDLGKNRAKRAPKKLNKTGSEVFQEFESLLKDEFQSDFNPIQIPNS